MRIRADAKPPETVANKLIKQDYGCLGHECVDNAMCVYHNDNGIRVGMLVFMVMLVK